MTAPRGLAAIERVFSDARAENRGVVIPYLAIGYPTPEQSLSLVDAAIRGGADLIELGIPFSDPLADGPTIQRATQTALEQGTTVRRCLEIAAKLRHRHPTIPLLFMGYINPILAHGESAFVSDCVEAGVDGLIVPDLPLEESVELEAHCREVGIALVYLLAPNTPPDRAQTLCNRTSGYVYLVSVAGTTGARDQLAENLMSLVVRVRSMTDKPIAIGFGISTGQHASEVAQLADGVIVGSAVVTRCSQANAEASVQAFVSELRCATTRG